MYRVEEDQYYSGEEPYHVNVTPHISGPVWREEVPEISEMCRIAYTGGQLFTYRDNKYFEDGIAAVDSSFFDIFPFEFKFGNKESVLRESNSLVLTEDISEKYFGKENPVGLSIQVNQEERYTISGVVAKLPRNTIIDFNVLLPWVFIESQQYYSDSWGNNSILIFVKIEEGSIDTLLNRKITEVTNIYKENNTNDYSIAPLSGIHLHSYFGFGNSPGAILYVYIFTAIALFVMLIACINFMNLSTARSSIHAKGIGLRKVNGAARGQLVRQHLSESFIQTMISVILAFLIVLLLLNKFNQVSGTGITLSKLLNIQYILGILAMLLVTTLLAGSYPALYLSALKPLEAIRDQSDPRTGSGLLRKILVEFQFTLADPLITGALVASRQLMYMRNAELGYNKSNLVHIELRGNLNQEYEMLKEEFMRNPGIINSTASMQPPYRIGSNSSGIDWDGKDPEQDVLVSFTGVHYNFVEITGITMESGRDFSRDYPADMYQDTVANFIINKILADIIGKDDIVGMELDFMGIAGHIVGVFEDYHFKPLGNEIEPMALAPLPPESMMHMIVRLAPENPQSALKFIEERWAELLPQYPLEYTFVDAVIEDMYQAEERVADLLNIFTLVAIIIASLGLFALSSFTAERRSREIGIRTIMGAMEGQITVMMIRDFSLYIVISLLIALPSVWFIARWWLSDFSFRIKLKADIFLITALITVLVAILTVLFHAMRTARTNPIEALRYE